MSQRLAALTIILDELRGIAFERRDPLQGLDSKGRGRARNRDLVHSFCVWSTTIESVNELVELTHDSRTAAVCGRGVDARHSRSLEWTADSPARFDAPNPADARNVASRIIPKLCEKV